ncbi:MAG: hypothetical protein R2691_04125 [Solirubrobacterales bacterium]
MLRVALLPLILACLLAAPVGAGVASAGKPRPGHHGDRQQRHILTGVNDTGQTKDFRRYARKTASRPDLIQSFVAWGTNGREQLERWRELRVGGVLSISTAPCFGCEEVITPAAIAKGKDDGWILALAGKLAHLKKRSYVRLLPEMNGFNPYSAYGGAGGKRTKSHSTAWFRAAFKRFHILIHGGPKRHVAKRLRAARLRPLGVRVRKRRLPSPRVGLIWCPQLVSAPDIKGNRPAAYYPGRRYVDWVGADFYNNDFDRIGNLTRFSRRYARKTPMALGEWSYGTASDDPRFVHAVTGWVRKHAKMALFYQGFGEGRDNPYELEDYPRSLVALRRDLNGRLFR